MSKKQNGRAAVKSANNTSNTTAGERVDTSTREMLEIETLDTGAADRVIRWRKHAEAYINKIKNPKAFDEIRVMAEKHGMSMVDWVVEYLKETRLNVKPSDGTILGTRHNRWIDWTYDFGSKRARTSNETEKVHYAFYHLGMGFQDKGLTVDDMRVLADNFATDEDWNLAPAKDRAVKFAVEDVKNKRLSKVFFEVSEDEYRDLEEIARRDNVTVEKALTDIIIRFLKKAQSTK
jgi:hypothetical protein